MNKAMRQQLEAVVNSIVNEDTKAGTKALHEYIRAKSQQILLGEKNDSDEDDSDEDDSDEDDSDEEADKPAFLKKKSKKKSTKKAKDEEED